jgi:Fe2+ transport system protein FeoA
MKPLSDLQRGEYGYIVDMRDSRSTLQLFDLGCFPGDLICVEANLPERDYMTVRCRNHCYHLNKPTARTIITHEVSYEFCLN